MPYFLLILAMIAGASSAMAAPEDAPAVGRYAVYEHTITWQSTGYTNPWMDVRLGITLTSPSGRTIDISGFYYGHNTWKFRFAPSEVGEWKWKAEIKDKLRTETYTGSFRVADSKNPGFVRQNPYNKFRWVFDDGTPYYPLGIGDCLQVGRGAKTPFERMGLDGGFRTKPDMERKWEVGLDKYLTVYAAAGINLFRWSVDNCAFGLYAKIDPTGSFYGEQESIWGDQLVETLRKHDFRIYMAFFGFKPPFPTDSKDPAKMEAVKRCVDYVVARYGAYVDFWELMNEYPGSGNKIDDDWYRQIASYLKSIDPYHHPVSTSWQRPDIAEIDISSPHWYERENEFDSDVVTEKNITYWKSAGKPVIVGEQGNQTANWDTRSAVRMRLRTWTAFFMEGTLIFWNSTFAKDYRSWAANIYLGPEERRYIKVLQKFNSGFDPRAKMVAVEATPKTKVRGFGLSGPETYAVYLNNYVDHSNPTSRATVKVAPSFAGTATWISPSTGKTLGVRKVAAGEQVLQVPQFRTDVALKIVAASSSAATIGTK